MAKGKKEIKLTCDFLDLIRRRAKFVKEVRPDGEEVTYEQAICNAFFDYATGFDEEIVDIRGDVKIKKHLPAAWAMQDVARFLGITNALTMELAEAKPEKPVKPRGKVGRPKKEVVEPIVEEKPESKVLVQVRKLEADRKANLNKLSDEL